MDADDRQYMLTRLRPLAELLGPQGPAAWKWTSLKSHLAQRFDGQHLENHSREILELFTECLSTQGQLPSMSAPITSQSTTSSSGCAPFAPPPSSVSESSMMETQLSSRSSPTNANSKTSVDEGFIRITPTEYDGARFSYTNREENFVGWHILKRNELLSQLKDNKIWLTFFLESKPKRSYKLEFKARKKASFDVSLGLRWKDEGEEEADENTIKGMVRRPAQGTRTNSPIQTLAGNSNPGNGMPPAEYAGHFLRALWAPRGDTYPLDAQSMPPSSKPIPFRRNEAPAFGRVETSVESRTTMKNASRDNSIEPRARNVPAKSCRTESDASTSGPEIFDRNENEDDEYSESSAPDNLEEDRGSFDRRPLATLEEECYHNPWET